LASSAFRSPSGKARKRSSITSAQVGAMFEYIDQEHC
jgi:hypothetical protein